MIRKIAACCLLWVVVAIYTPAFASDVAAGAVEAPAPVSGESLAAGVTATSDGIHAEESQQAGHDGIEKTTSEKWEHAGHEAEEEHGYHANHIALMGGAAIEIEDGHTAAHATTGLDYEYRLPFVHGLFGAGALVEASFVGMGKTPIWIFGVPLFVHPVAGLKIWFAPSVEFKDEHAAFLSRLGLGYDFHVGPLSIGPVANLDLVHGLLVQVYGLAVGTGF